MSKINENNPNSQSNNQFGNNSVLNPNILNEQEPEINTNDTDLGLLTRVPLQSRPSRLVYLETSAQKLDIRAHQRTYQGAYIRTCLGCLSFSILVLKLFSKEFFSIGLVFNFYGLLVCLIGFLRSNQIDIYFINFSDPKWSENFENIGNDGDGGVDNCYYFKTSGNFVLLLTIISLSCYSTLFVLLLRT